MESQSSIVIIVRTFGILWTFLSFPKQKDIFDIATTYNPSPPSSNSFHLSRQPPVSIHRLAGVLYGHLYEVPLMGFLAEKVHVAQ